MYLYSLTPGLLVNGPGKRFTIHTSGCSIRCAGCFSRHTWKAKSGMLQTPKEIADLVAASSDEGVAISGGEPTEQEDLEELLSLLYDLDLPNGIVLFSGRAAEDISLEYPFIRKYVDLLVAGPFVKELAVTDGLRSSDNQVYMFGGRNRIGESDIGKTSVQLTITREGDTVLAGFPHWRTT